jgi:putative lipoic acid-binding regulatory protein
VITDGEYPGRVAYSLIGKAMEEFSKQYGSSIESYNKDTELRCEALEGLILKYQSTHVSLSALSKFDS